jgi:hypothetical protein
MKDISEKLYNFFSETYDIYIKVKKYAVLLEKVSGGKVEVASINELRGVLFHLYSYLDKPEHTKAEHITENYYDAKEHLFRAYYDVFSILTELLTEKIHSYSINYNTAVICKVCPKYYQEILPGISTFAEQIADIRSVRQNNKTPELSVIGNDEVIIILHDWFKTLQSLTPSFEKAKKEHIQEKLKGVIYQIYIPVICVIVTIILSYIFLKN